MSTKDDRPLEERAKAAAAYVMADEKTVTLSSDGIRAMAEYIHGIAKKSVGPSVGSCPICDAPPGKCDKAKHGYKGSQK